MNSYNYMLTIQYDGSRYHGWQSQNNTENTIQNKLETVLAGILGYEVDIIGSGRTDAGVHAIAQTSNVHIREEMDPGALMDELNRYLPEDIAVTSVVRVDDRFHARYNAISKTYRYRIHTGKYSNVFERKYVYPYKRKSLDVELMRSAASYIIGEHDFKAFCGNPRMKKSTVRNVTNISIEEKDNEIVIEYTGNGFLQNMVRIMTGTLIEIGNGTKQVQDMKIIIESKDRQQAGYTAPPNGLCLVRVIY